MAQGVVDVVEGGVDGCGPGHLPQQPQLLVVADVGQVGSQGDISVVRKRISSSKGDIRSSTSPPHRLELVGQPLSEVPIFPVTPVTYSQGSWSG